MNYMAIKNEKCPQHCFKFTAPLAFNLRSGIFFFFNGIIGGGHDLRLLTFDANGK